MRPEGHLAPLPRIREEAPAVTAGEAPPEVLDDEAASDPESSKHDTISDLLMGSRGSSSSSAAPSQRKEATKRDQGEELEDKPAKEIKLDADAPVAEPATKAARGDPGSAPTSPSSSLFPLKFAGKVTGDGQEEYQDEDEGYHEDELWEDLILRDAEWEVEEDDDLEDSEDCQKKSWKKRTGMLPRTNWTS